MRETKLLFVSTEVNVPENADGIGDWEIIKISVTAILKGGEKKLSTWHIRPKNIESVTQNTFETTKISRESLLAGKYINETMHLIANKYGTAQTIIMWSGEHCRLLCLRARQSGVKLSQRVVVLPELIEVITKNHAHISDIRTALKEKYVKYDNRQLHNTVVSVDYAYSLYNKLHSEYKSACNKSNIKCCRSSKRNIIHSRDCAYTKRIIPSNLISADAMDIFGGSAVCKSCAKKYFGMLDWQRTCDKTIELKPSFDDDYIYELCRYFDLECSIGERVIFVRSNVANWRIYHNGSKVQEVYHQNYRPKASDYTAKKRKINNGFHKQNIRCKDSLYEVVRYIYTHDSGYIDRLVKKKSRIEMLFEQVENSLHEEEKRESTALN